MTATSSVETRMCSLLETSLSQVLVYFKYSPHRSNHCNVCASQGAGGGVLAAPAGGRGAAEGGGASEGERASEEGEGPTGGEEQTAGDRDTQTVFI